MLQGMAQPGSKARDKIEHQHETMKMEETEKIQATEFATLQQPGLAKKSNHMLRDGEGKREMGRYKLFAEQEVEDGAQVLAISWQWFQRLEEGEEAAMEEEEARK